MRSFLVPQRLAGGQHVDEILADERIGAAVAAAAAGVPLGTVVPDGQETAEVLLINEQGGEAYGDETLFDQSAKRILTQLLKVLPGWLEATAFFR